MKDTKDLQKFKYRQQEKMVSLHILVRPVGLGKETIIKILSGRNDFSNEVLKNILKKK